ncbi:MAG: hypothetical protein MJK12_19235 [Colwellia sp.]|nr:hypothetical protein [Colwellia sp.]
MTEISNPELNELVIYALTTILIVTIILATIAACLAICKNPETASNALKDFFNGGDALKILTVFAVLITATFLALAGELSDAAIALLSSISGYVLGSMNGKKNSKLMEK